jgi:hypothetical protein
MLFLCGKQITAPYSLQYVFLVCRQHTDIIILETCRVLLEVLFSNERVTYERVDSRVLLAHRHLGLRAYCICLSYSSSSEGQHRHA